MSGRDRALIELRISGLLWQGLRYPSSRSHGVQDPDWAQRRSSESSRCLLRTGVKPCLPGSVLRPGPHPAERDQAQMTVADSRMPRDRKVNYSNQQSWDFPIQVLGSRGEQEAGKCSWSKDSTLPPITLA